MVDRFEHLYNAQPSTTIIKWVLSTKNAFDEILCFHCQSLYLFHTRRPQIACPVADTQIVPGGAIGAVDALIVNFDLFIRFKVIPYEHLLLSTDQGGPHFDWREPVQIQVSDHLIREIHCDEGHIFDSIHVPLTCRDNGFGSTRYQVIDNR